MIRNKTSNETGDKINWGCIGLAFSGIAIIPATVLQGWVLSVLWRWFIAAHFHLPELGVAQAIGVSLALNYLICDTDWSDCVQRERTFGERISNTLVHLFGRPLLALLFGWIVKAWL